MTKAILEILGLLTVSCLIGIFFTYRYWRAKWDSLKGVNAESQKSLEEERSSLRQEIRKSETLRTELDTCKKSKSSGTATHKEQSTDLLEKIELLEEEMAEKEREIEVLSLELEDKRISYYKQIDGKRYKAITIKMADESIAGQGDGRISMEDAEKVFATISDGQAYTQVEKDTMRYLRDHYNWTEGADELFRTKVRSWAAKGHHLD